MSNEINLRVFRFAVSLIHKTFADVPEADMRHQPIAAMNPPVWILGHLVTVLGFIPKMLGGESGCPREYSEWFGPGSKLEELPATLPTKAELLNQLSDITERILVAVPKVSAEEWSRPNPTPFFQAELPTLADITENVLVGHTMLHLGQMSVWRRSHGLPRVITVPTR